MNELATIARYLTAPDSRAAVLTTLVSVQGPPIVVAAPCSFRPTSRRSSSISGSSPGKTCWRGPRRSLPSRASRTRPPRHRHGNGAIPGAAGSLPGVVQVLLGARLIRRGPPVLDANLRAHQSTALAIVGKIPAKPTARRSAQWLLPRCPCLHRPKSFVRSSLRQRRSLFSAPGMTRNPSSDSPRNSAGTSRSPIRARRRPRRRVFPSPMRSSSRPPPGWFRGSLLHRTPWRW